MNKKQKSQTISEDELLKTIEQISKKLAYKFKFGYHELEDMKQQISLFAIEGLANYDYKRPLENFLWTHVRNRLFNYKRDNYQRPDKPCNGCVFHDILCANTDKDCKEFSNKLDCTLYKTWYSRNSSKKNLMHLSSIEDLKEYMMSSNSNENFSLNIENREFIDILERELFGEHREIYLKIKMEIKVSKKELIKLNNMVKEILP